MQTIITVTIQICTLSLGYTACQFFCCWGICTSIPIQIAVHMYIHARAYQTDCSTYVRGMVLDHYHKATVDYSGAKNDVLLQI